MTEEETRVASITETWTILLQRRDDCFGIGICAKRAAVEEVEREPSGIASMPEVVSLIF